MIGLLLVEDEEAIKDKLMNNVSWADYGFAPVLGASNGAEALAILDKYPIKIMVTDIQMPKINGMELIKEAKKRGYQLKIIVISGFAEFEYAQESIKLNVSDYLLKPFASRRLLAAVLRLKEELATEVAEEFQVKDLREQMEKSKSGLIEKLLLDLLNGNIVNNLEAQLDFLGIKALNNQGFQVAVMEISNNQLQEMTVEEKNLLNIQFFQQIKQLFAGIGYQNYLINHHHNQVVLIVIRPDQELLKCLEEVLTQVRLTLKLTVACGVGHQYFELTDLAIAYREAGSALQYRYFYGQNQVFLFNELNPDVQSYRKIINSLQRYSILDNLKIGADAAVTAELEKFINEMRQVKLNQELSTLVASNLILSVFTTINKLGYNVYEMQGDNDETLVKLNRVESLEELEELLISFFNQINRQLRQKTIPVNYQLVEEIRQYLDDNFAEDVTLTAMADRYKISPSYLSLLFSERIGKNFIDYLTECRIRKGQELLKHTNLKIYEISNAVGYNDSFYFSNCFKKIVGVPPSEYRESTKN